MFFGCAESEDHGDAKPDAAGVTVPDGASSPVEDATAPFLGDGGCDAGDPNCVVETITCAQTAWCPIAAGVDARYSLTAISGTSATDAWIVGAAGTTMHWDGTAWTILPSLTPYTLRAVSSTAPDDVWAVGAYDMIFHYAPGDAGAPGWTKVTAPASGAQVAANSLCRAVWAKGDDVVVAGDVVSVRPPGKPLTYQQEWQSKRDPIAWTALPGFDALNVYGLWGADTRDLWLVGFNTKRGGVAYRRAAAPADGGLASWLETDIQESNLLSAVWGNGADDVWAVGSRGTLRHWTGEATGWQIVESPTQEDLNAVWGFAANDVWAVGDFGTLIHWNGAKWQSTSAAFTAGLKPHLYGVWGSSPSNVWAVGQNGVVLHFSGSHPQENGDQP